MLAPAASLDVTPGAVAVTAVVAAAPAPGTVAAAGADVTPAEAPEPATTVEGEITPSSDATPAPTSTSTETATPTPSVTEEPTATQDPTATDEPTATEEATPSTVGPTGEESGTIEPTPAPSVTVIWQQPPAVQSSPVTGLMVGVAIAALVLAAVLVALLRRRDARRLEGARIRAGGPPGTAPAPAGPPPSAPPPDATDETMVLDAVVHANPPEDAAPTPPFAHPATSPAAVTAFLVLLGEALIDCASPVAEVQRVLGDVAAVNGHPHTEVIALPTAVLISIPGTESQTAAAAAGGRSFRLDQVEDVLTLAESARRGETGTAQATVRLLVISASPAPYRPAVLVAGYALYSVGLSLILGGGWLDLVVAAALGALLALARRRGAGRLSVEALVVLVSAFVAGLVVFGLVRLGAEVGVLPTLVPPLVMFLPGALLTTGVIDLATRQMIAGAARLASGVMQMVLLTLGVSAAAGLIGVRAGAIADTAEGIGVLGPWLGVLLFVAGVGLYHCVRPASLPWVLLVVGVAYAGQVIGGLLLGGVMSAFVGAAVMTPVALYAASTRTGPPALVSFLPGFWVLVPGALALVGLTQTIGADADATVGTATLLTAGMTMVTVSLGVLVGLAVYGVVDGWRGQAPGERSRMLDT